jgi:ubiquinone/menaquinone biosynthesis C-methylase UbiE
MAGRRVFAKLGLCMLSSFAVGAAGASAQLGQLPADEYIDQMDGIRRVEQLRVDEVVGALDLKPGDVVADIGSGSGIFTVALARAVGPTGRVYAVDIDQEMIDFVLERARQEGLTNVEGVFAEYDDPKLPVTDVDFAFYHRTLHMIEHRQAHLNATAKYLAPDGRVVVVEQGRETTRIWMWLEREHVDQWLAAISFYPAKVVEGFDPRWFVIYQRPYGDSMLPGAGPR